MLRAKSLADSHYSELDFPAVTRLALMVTPKSRGSFRDQAREVLEVIQGVLENRPSPATMTIQTVFLRNPHEQAECERLFREFLGLNAPVTNFVTQPPCCGAALSVEAWAIAGQGVRLQRFGPQVLATDFQGLRFIYCGGVSSRADSQVYARARTGFHRMQELLELAGSGFEHVVRTWLYIGGITDADGGTSRYEELNRARTDFFSGIAFGRGKPVVNGFHHVYPASTGIGTLGNELVLSCMALETERKDVLLVPLENPRQTSAYAYSARYSVKSPKFSRGMALVLGDYVTTWISGTASIVNSETYNIGDVEAQTEQTIDNIEGLIAEENFARHGIESAGATLADLAKIRVYLKRSEDLNKCRAICERRFGAIPAIYVAANICREDLLVEIEGVAFSRCMPKLEDGTKLTSLGSES